MIEMGREKQGNGLEPGIFWSPEPITAYKVQLRESRLTLFPVSPLTGRFIATGIYDRGVKYTAQCTTFWCEMNAATARDFAPYLLLKGSQYNTEFSPHYFSANNIAMNGSCGFYAYKNFDALAADSLFATLNPNWRPKKTVRTLWRDFLELWVWDIIENRIYLEVKLEGRIVEHEHGYRAQYQTITRPIRFFRLKVLNYLWKNHKELTKNG